MRKQTCNREYTKHCTRSRHQLKMATPAEVSKTRPNFQIKQFKEKHHFNIAANLTLNTMVSFILLLIVRTARIAYADRQTVTQDNYCNPRCACAPRVNNSLMPYQLTMPSNHTYCPHALTTPSNHNITDLQYK